MIFDHLRAAYADDYIAHPLDRMDASQLQAVADALGLSVDDLRTQERTPHISMTCPLCGRAASHLVQCKGCGGDAWGFELELCHGEEAVDSLRAGLAAALHDADPAAVAPATEHAYQMGGCLVCAACWQETRPYSACYSCPLKLLSDRTLEGPGNVPSGYFRAMLQGQSEGQWWQTVIVQWTTDQPETVVGWRKRLIAGGI